jgi:O-antigen ligase
MTAPAAPPALPPLQVQAAVAPAPAAPGGKSRADWSERWAAVVYVIALLLVYFQGNVAERMASRLLPIAALVILLGRPRRDVLTRVVPLALAGFVVWATASWVWSSDRSGTQIVLLTFVSQVIVAWCCGSFLTLRSWHRLTTLVAKALCVLTVAFLVVAPGLSTRPAEDGAPGWHGPFSHKNGLGSFLVLALLCFWFDRGMKRSHRICWLAVGAILLVGSQSSTAMTLALVSVAALIWQSQTGRHAPLWRRISWLAGLLAVLASVGLILITKFDVVTGLLGRGSSLSGRTNIWSVVVERIQEKPFTGWGFGGVWRPESLPSQQMWQEMRFHAYHAHSGYLDLLLQVGVVGLLLYLTFAFATLRRHWRARAQSALHLWAALVLLTVCLNAVTESAPFFSDGLIFLIGFAVVRDGNHAAGTGYASPARRARRRSITRASARPLILRQIASED